VSGTQFHEDVMVRANWSCEIADLLPGHRCRRHLQAMHIIPATRIKTQRLNASIRVQAGRTTIDDEPLLQLPLEVVLADTRNGMSGCLGGHVPWDLLGERCDREQLREDTEQFAIDFNLVVELDRLFGMREADLHELMGDEAA
jgi:hypothetical protein